MVQISKRKSPESDAQRCPDASPTDGSKPIITATDNSQPFEELAALYGEYLKPLAVALRSIYGDGPPDPEEVAQEAFHRVVNHKNPASISNLKAFIWRTARNLVIDEKKRVSVRSRYDFEIEQLFFAFEGGASTPETLITAREQLELINEALGKMPEKRRRAFVLHRVEGMTITETGRRLGIGRTAAAKHIARAAADLHALLLE
ncbi:MAG: RNA polymerase sigma factor [Pseudomonadota bacterium]